MKAIESLPAKPLNGETILSLNESDTDMVVLPVSYYQEKQIYSLAIMADDFASVAGFDGDKWVEIARSTPDSGEEFDPEEGIDEWMQETHPELYDDPEFEVTSQDYDLD